MNPDTLLYNFLYSFMLAGTLNSEYASEGNTVRRWMVPVTSAWDGYLLDPAAMAAAFDRYAANNACCNALQSGSTGEHNGKLVEVAYLGMLERSFRVRHMTALRSQCHVAGRQAAHGNTYGIFAQTENYIQQLLSQV